MNLDNIKLAHLKKASNNNKSWLTRQIVQKFKNKHIPEGLYLSERNVFDTTGFDEARHVFLTSVYNRKPRHLPSKKLDNGQYATIFSMNSGIIGGLPFGGNFLAMNGHSGDRFFDINDVKCVNELVTNKNNDMHSTALYPITENKRRRYALVRKIKSIMDANKERDLGFYQLFDIPGLVQKNNCVSVAAALMTHAGIKPKELPEQIGNIGGMTRDEIVNYRNLIPEKENTKKASVSDEYSITATKKKKKKNNGFSIMGLLTGKTPEQQLKEEKERQFIEENPELWNKLNEEDLYPEKDSKGNAISALGAGAGLVYGLGRGYLKSKEDNHFGTPQIIASGLGFGALGFGLATTKDLITRGLGRIAGKLSKPRTKADQIIYDSKKQIYSVLPGFDTYNAELRRRAQEEEDIDDE